LAEYPIPSLDGKMPNTLREIKRFIDVAVLQHRSRPKPSIEEGINPFVTISRQVGAGGRSLARSLLAELEKQPDEIYHGWKIFDRELCEKLVDEPSLRNSLRRLWSDEYHSEVESLILALLGSATAQPAAARELFKAIRTVATLGKVIIVGRGGVCITASLLQGVHLRLTASEPARLKRMDFSSLSQAEAIKRIRRQEKDRVRLLKSYFHEDISDPLLYDAIWNTDHVPMEIIASAVIPLIRYKVDRFHHRQ
jgi:cytidylate kinase